VATDCGPGRKPWVTIVNATKAPQGRQKRRNAHRPRPRPRRALHHPPGAARTRARKRPPHSTATSPARGRDGPNVHLAAVFITNPQPLPRAIGEMKPPMTFPLSTKPRTRLIRIEWVNLTKGGPRVPRPNFPYIHSASPLLPPRPLRSHPPTAHAPVACQWSTPPPLHTASFYRTNPPLRHNPSPHNPLHQSHPRATLQPAQRLMFYVFMFYPTTSHYSTTISSTFPRIASAAPRRPRICIPSSATQSCRWKSGLLRFSAAACSNCSIARSNSISPQ
jgi:hypothetical protein